MATKPDDETEEDDSSDEGAEGVKIPEDFQQAVHSLLDDCDSEECIQYVQSCCSKKMSDMSKQSMDTEGMPDSGE